MKLAHTAQLQQQIAQLQSDEGFESSEPHDVVPVSIEFENRATFFHARDGTWLRHFAEMALKNMHQQSFTIYFDQSCRRPISLPHLGELLRVRRRWPTRGSHRCRLKHVSKRLEEFFTVCCCGVPDGLESMPFCGVAAAETEGRGV